MTMRRVLVVLAIAFGALSGTVRDAAAQFETPNRAFHNSYAFRLDGKHQSVPCASCHLNGQYAGTPNTCYQCHWIRRQDDRYQTRLGTQCEQCHRPVSWTATRFDHGAMTGVQIGVSHGQLACETCHTNGQFRATATGCVSCHQRDFAATTAPNHVAAGFPVTCDMCHRPADSSWRNNGGSGFSHNAVFALVGTHATQTCVACHKNNVYRGTPRDCVGCHLPRYAATTSPNHAAAGFPTTCESCHRATDASWQGTGFNHSAVFALVGTHATQTCVACHKSNVYRGTPRDCVGCHLPRYAATTSPNHVAAGFPTTCESCHRATDASWKGTSFNHNSVFALVGTHATQTCAACHKNNVYKGTARDCVGCHLPRYTATTSPNHVAAGFPTTCQSCHRAADTSWNQGTFSHTQFPLRGAHNVTCSRCHTTPGNFKVFSCTTCHDRAKTDSQHRERAGYRYDSVACYSCHANGRN